MKHKQTKSTSIPKEVRQRVYMRDNCRCVVCGKKCYETQASSHIVRRSQGGLGIEQNIVTHCLVCHSKYDSYNDEVVQKTLSYVKNKYKDWNREDMIYSKWRQK